MIETDELFTIKEASAWATEYLGKTVTTSNISYLIQYGRIKKIGINGTTQVSKQELINYYKLGMHAIGIDVSAFNALIN